VSRLTIAVKAEVQKFRDRVGGGNMLDKPKRPYRLGLDLGSNSLGWFVVYLEKCGNRYEPVDLGPGGVRIFPDGRDPQSKASNAVDRRMARGARK
jgi:CRISPR-associated endonuclease Csn1